MTSVNFVRCPYCQEANLPDVGRCRSCGADLVEARYRETSNVTDIIEREESSPRWGATAFTGDHQLILYLRASNQSVKVNLHPQGSAIVGRQRAAELDGMTAVDLTPYGALESGVSRAHARLDWRDGKLYLSDLGARNGTFLNRKQLKPDETRVLRDGDEIMLATMTLHVIFKAP